MLAIFLASLLAVSQALDCDFENGMCGWKNHRDNMIDWIRRKGATPTVNTGPNGDHTSGKGFYVFMNAKKGQRDDDAALVYKGFTGSKCLTFWYHMNGRGVGRLQVWVDNMDVLVLKGPKGNAWKKAQVQITGKNSPIEFYAVRGGRKGDIAIDDIKLTDNCGPSPTTDKPTPPTAHPTPPLPSSPPVPGGSCGMKGKSRIVGGSAAKENEWPWQAFIMDRNKNQFCGGSLIDPRWILTAAHCIDGENTKTVQVRLGAHKRKGEKPDGTVQDFKVIRIIKHEKYNKNTQSNDVALLELDSEAKLSSDVNLVCLPESIADPSHGQKCWTTGWGTLSSGGSQPGVLHEVEVPAVSHDVCNKAYKGQIDKTMICAGLKEGGKDACQGDSGGPFVCGKGNGNSERFFLHGVTSWGHGCAAKEKYGVYARVSVFMDWIRKGMGKPQKPGPTTAPSITTQPPVSTSAPSGGCGKGPNSRIVGGTEATHGDYPWQALLQTARTNRQFCGGTLVKKQWVVTAAHCVEGQRPRDIIVRMGAHYRVQGSLAEHAKEQKFKLIKIIKHASYNKPIQMGHDIALLKLERPANLDGYINLACLPLMDAVVGDSCVITGWGTLQSGGSQPDKMQVATVPVVSQSSCETAYGAKNIHDSMVCAGLAQGGVDSCQGDSGGPMVCKDAAGLYNLHGVTSWGYGCADAGKYGVYARVKYLTTWINNQINSN